MIVTLLGLAAATLVSEDLAAIAAGVLVARGEADFLAASFACFAGIYAGDMLLFLLGRRVGRPLLARPPLKHLVRPEALRRASRWLDAHGAAAVFLSRVVPGMRLPTYVAAGVLETRPGAFALCFALAAALWTPLLVGTSALAGGSGRSAATLIFCGVLLLFLIRHVVVRVLTYRGRKLLVSSALRATRFEFWPPWIVYAPLVPYLLYLAIRHRGLTVFTATNPGMPAGGFVGESKSEILAALARGGAPVARFAAIGGDLAPEAKLERARVFLASIGSRGLVVLKPDRGERGKGVAIVRDTEELARRLAASREDVILQEHVSGIELGIFYARRPQDERGRVISIGEKRFPFVTADGVRTIERLVLDDARGVLMARFHLARLAERLPEVPAAGEIVPLAEIGNHCRGALFLDASSIATPELEEAVERASRAHPGFFFGRYDVRAASLEEARCGRFTILELNGVTSEGTDLYDPRHSALDAWQRLFAQWRLAYEIGAANRDRGSPAARPMELLRLLR